MSLIKEVSWQCRGVEIYQRERRIIPNGKPVLAKGTTQGAKPSINEALTEQFLANGLTTVNSCPVKSNGFHCNMINTLARDPNRSEHPEPCIDYLVKTGAKIIGLN